MMENNTQPKRILVFSLMYYPKYVGGAEVALKEITDRVDPSQVHFDMITLHIDASLPKYERIGNMHIYRIGPTLHTPTFEHLSKFPAYLIKVLYIPLATIKAFLLHRKNKYDGAWAMMSYMGLPLVFLRLFFGTKIPYLVTLQEGDTVEHVFGRLRIRLVGYFYSLVYKQAKKVQVISTFLGEWARKAQFTGPLHIIPNGVDTRYFSKQLPDEELQNLKSYLGKKEDVKFLVTTSRLVQKNACDDVIRALTYLPDNIQFLIIGIGPDEKKLRELAKELGVEKRVLFLGFVDYLDIPKYLKISDVFVRPSLSEGMGNSFIEAMAAGIPVVATQVGGIADFLFDSIKNPNEKSTGRAVLPRDPQGIAQAVEAFLNDKKKTSEIVSNAQELVFIKYDWNFIAKQMKDIL